MNAIGNKQGKQGKGKQGKKARAVEKIEKKRKLSKGTTSHSKVLPQPSEPLKVYSIKLPSKALQFLDDLSQDATDNLGRPISNSALIRALLTYIQQQPASWPVKALYPLIEKEIKAGRVWGRKIKKE